MNHLLGMPMPALEFVSQRLGAGVMAGVPYDTAAVAALRAPGTGCAPRFPRAVAWVASRQNPDGSWGGTATLPHERVVATLQSVVCLADLPEHAEACRGGLRYLEGVDADWRDDRVDTIAFELLVPRLVEQVAVLGLGELDLPGLDHVRAQREQKMALIGADLLTAVKATSAAHALEAVGDALSDDELRTLPTVEGAPGASPAAAAYLVSRIDDEDALHYLEDIAQHADGSFPTVYPFGVFELCWVSYLMQQAGTDLPAGVSSALPRLERLLRGRGLGLTEGMPSVDADDTGMAVSVLARCGRDATAYREDLLSFFNGEFFVCMAGERTPSVTPNARCLEAALRVGIAPEQLEGVVRFIVSEQRAGSHWADKWHVSPYYATAQISFAAPALPSSLFAGTLDWLRDTQRGDGGWGLDESTVEETAWGILTVQALRAHGQLDTDALVTRLGRARDLILSRLPERWWESLDPTLFPAMYIGKGYYQPENITVCAVASALICCDSMLREG